MIRPRFRSWLLVGVILTTPLLAWGQIPSDALLNRLQPQGYVSDFANVISPADRQMIEQRIEALHAKTGAEIAVVTLTSLEGGQIDDFANRLYAKWGIGQRSRNNGALILVAIQDRKARIETGYGIEAYLPDALAGRILDEEMFPRFKQARFSEGIRAGALRVAEIMEKREPASQQLAHGPAPQRSSVGAVLFLGLFVAIGSFILGYAVAARQGFVALWGLLFGGIALGIGLLSGGLLARILLPIIAVPTFALGIAAGRNQPMPPRGRRLRKSSPTPGNWVWFPTTTSSGGWGSGGFSGGGFGGFGGGSSGGGGASGGW